MLAGVAWWARNLGPVPTVDAATAKPKIVTAADQDRYRQVLLETLDRVVSYEHYYRSVYGHYTRFLNRIGYSIPRAVSEIYEIRVAEASPHRLVLAAFSELDGRIEDFVTIDDRFRVRAGFELPSPRPEYLRSVAQRHLRALRDAGEGKLPEETGIFTGFFQYATQRDQGGKRAYVALGVRAPVTGIQVELGADGAEELEIGAPFTTGQRPNDAAMSTLEEAYLAQKIFRGEMGRYARTWAELSRITAFRFEDRDQFGGDASAPFGDGRQTPEIEAENSRGLAGEIRERENDDADQLVIEPIGGNHGRGPSSR